MNTENFKLGTTSLFNIGDIISKNLNENGVEDISEFYIYLDEKHFRRVDEDLFYRMRENKEEEFIPSENEIILNFEKVKIIIKLKK
jgi:hypothetical protein